MVLSSSFRASSAGDNTATTTTAAVVSTSYAYNSFDFDINSARDGCYQLFSRKKNNYNDECKLYKKKEKKNRVGESWWLFVYKTDCSV